MRSLVVAVVQFASKIINSALIELFVVKIKNDITANHKT